MNIFETHHYKVFLRHFIAHQPRKGRGFSKSLAEHLRLNQSQISQIISGSREFNEEQAVEVAKFLALPALETEYFMNLVALARAGTPALKKYYETKITNLKKESLQVAKRIPHDRSLNEEEKSIFYSSYLYSALRIYSSLGDGKTLAEMSDKFALPREKLIEIISFLVKTNLCVEQNGYYKPGTQHTHIGKDSPFLSRHHLNWRIKAQQAVDRLSDSELQLTAPLSISRKDFMKVRESLLEVANQTFTTVKATEPEDLACLLIDWFWIQN